MAEIPIHRRRLADLIDSTGARIVEQGTADGVPLAGLPEMRLRWYHIGATRAADRVTSTAGDEPGTTEANVYVYDSIGGSMGVNAKRFAAELDDVDADVIHLRINSPGGSVFDALAIMNSLRTHPARVVAHVDGMAASAASVIMLAGDEVVIEPGGEVMTHRASSEYSGDDLSVDAWKTWLQRQTENVADLYAQRSGRPREEWLDLMTAETWFYGAEAVQYGLADRAEKLTRPPVEPGDDPDGDLAERMARRHVPRGYRYASRGEAGAPRRVERGFTSRSAPRGGVPSGVRDAGQLRTRAAARGLVQRNAPAGVTTMARRSAPSGDIGYQTVEHRGRQMIRTHGAFTVYGRRYEMWDMYGPYFEQVVQGSGTATITAADLDCIFLLNHTGLSMARTAGPWNEHRGTLNLEDRAAVGWHEAFLNPARQDVSDMVVAIDDRTVTEMSYAFLIEDGRWNDDMTVYSIYRYNMHRGDVSAVNYGASPYTDISARASEILAELQQMPAGAISEAVRILGQRVGAYEQLLREADPGAFARITEPVFARGGPTWHGDPALAEVRQEDKDRAREWVSNAIGDADVPPDQRRPADPDEAPDEDPDGDREQDEPAKVIDNTPASGPTVAGYEALLRSMTAN
jgi:ATP-dependent protease ClpP protease subunit